GAAIDAGATRDRAGVIAEVVEGVSPFFSYTESFEPVSGVDRDRNPLVPKSGRQYEAGIKFHPNDSTIVTVTGYHIKESNRPLSDDTTPETDDFIQVEAFTSNGVEFEARTLLPGQISRIANYSYNEAEVAGTDQQADNVPKHNASRWATKPSRLGDEVSLLLGGGVRHTAKNRSYGWAFPAGIVT